MIHRQSRKKLDVEINLQLSLCIILPWKSVNFIKFHGPHLIFSWNFNLHPIFTSGALPPDSPWQSNKTALKRFLEKPSHQIHKASPPANVNPTGNPTHPGHRNKAFLFGPQLGSWPRDVACACVRPHLHRAAHPKVQSSRPKHPIPFGFSAFLAEKMFVVHTNHRDDESDKNYLGFLGKYPSPNVGVPYRLLIWWWTTCLRTVRSISADSDTTRRHLHSPPG